MLNQGYTSGCLRVRCSLCNELR
ncbi:hypothetical protein ACFLQV_01190 [Calditrichota bacterium]